jgi:hypothetical protein
MLKIHTLPERNHATRHYLASNQSFININFFQDTTFAAKNGAMPKCLIYIQKDGEFQEDFSEFPCFWIIFSFKKIIKQRLKKRCKNGSDNFTSPTRLERSNCLSLYNSSNPGKRVLIQSHI